MHTVANTATRGDTAISAMALDAFLKDGFRNREVNLSTMTAW